MTNRAQSLRPYHSRNTIMEFNSRLFSLCLFLQDTLNLSSQEVAVALRRRQHPSDSLPMILWQYGLISLGELQKVLDWLDDWIEQ